MDQSRQQRLSLEGGFLTPGRAHSLREQAEADQMEFFLQGRKQELDKVSQLMRDIHSVAKDIGIEVKNQEKVVFGIQNNLTTAKENVEGGLG